MTERDLTTGSIRRGVLSLAVPTIASSFLNSIQNLVDMFFVGKLGKGALAGVGMSATAIMFLITVFMGLNISTVALISRATGARDRERACHVAGQALLLAALFSAAVGVVGYVASPLILRELGATGEVIDLGTGYLHVIFAGIFFTTAAFVTGGIFQGAGDAMTPFYLGLLVTGCNVILTPLLIHGYAGFPRMGVPGSAVATVTAGVIAFVVAVTILVRGRPDVSLRRRDLRPDWGIMWKMVAIGVPGSMQMSVRSLMNLVMMSIVAKFGTAVVAAYTVGIRLRMLGLLPSFGFGASAATMVGQNLGAERPERSSKSAWAAVWMALLVSGLAAAVLFVLARQVVAVFNNSEEVVAAGAHMLRVTAIALVASSMPIVLARAMSGAGDTVSPMVITLLALWGFEIPAAVYLSGVDELWHMRVPLARFFQPVALNSETGIWYAMVIASMLQAAITWAWFSTGRWQRKRI